jgi:uncharacterized RDD family membrane protein YckC
MVPGYGPPVLQGREFAGWWQRVGAALLDGIIILVGLIIFGYILQMFMMAREGEKNGMTLGKQALGIKVVREDGAGWTFGTALLREFVIKGLLFGTVGSFFLSIPTLVDYLWPLWDEKKQALHDKLATSYVVKA